MEVLVLDDVLNELADLLGIYGTCPNDDGCEASEKCICRNGFIMEFENKIRMAIEGFFSLLKRGIVGIYHFVSAKHLDNYLNEATFRYNSKSYTEHDRFNLLLSATDNKRLTYQNLIANANV